MKVPIPDDWDGVSWCEWAICWPDSRLWAGILQGLISYPKRGRFWDERTGTITTVQETGQEIINRNITLQECFMSCTGAAELAAAIEYLADRLSQKQCGCTGSTGSGGAGGTAQPPSEEDTGEPGNHTGDPPAGFSTWEEYDNYKCAVATLIVDETIQDLNYISEVQFGSSLSIDVVVALVSAGIVSPIPGDELIIIAGLIITALTLGALSNLYADLAGAINDVRVEIICALFSNSPVDVARDAALQEADGQIDLAMGTIAAGLAKQIIRSWFTPDNLNRLFEKDETRAYPAGDCGDCVQGDFEWIATDDNQQTLYNWAMTSDTTGYVEVVTSFSSNPTNWGSVSCVLSSDLVTPYDVRVTSYQVTYGNWVGYAPGNYGWTREASGYTAGLPNPDSVINRIVCRIVPYNSAGSNDTRIRFNFELIP